MKLQGLTLLILLLSLTHIKGQNTKIKGVKKFCHNNDTDRVERNIRLKKGTKIIKDSIDVKEGKFVIKNLPRGNYIIEFTNIFGQKIQKNILANKRKIEIEICIEDFKDTGEETFIQKLTTENKLQFHFESSGCSHYQTEKITFFQIGDETFGEFINTDNSSIKKKLTKEQIQYLITFERKLRRIENNISDCTTQDSYHLIMGKEELKILHESCDWDGYYEMRKEIFDLQ